MSRGDEGFTLPELMITSVILGVIMAAITGALIVGFKTTDTTNQRLVESHDAQAAGVLFVNDVASAYNVSRIDSACGGAGTLVSFTLTDTLTGTASYVLSGTNATRQLNRVFCPRSGAASTQPVASALGATGPSVSCSPDNSCEGVPGTSEPRTVTLSITDATGYAFDLTGTVRSR